MPAGGSEEFWPLSFRANFSGASPFEAITRLCPLLVAEVTLPERIRRRPIRPQRACYGRAFADLGFLTAAAIPTFAPNYVQDRFGDDAGERCPRQRRTIQEQIVNESTIEKEMGRLEQCTQNRQAQPG
jgi:hypothetical protein